MFVKFTLGDDTLPVYLWYGSYLLWKMGGLRSSWNLWDIFSNGFQSDLGSILQGAERGFYGFNYNKVMIWGESVIYDNNVLNDR